MLRRVVGSQGTSRCRVGRRALVVGVGGRQCPTSHWWVYRLRIGCKSRGKRCSLGCIPKLSLQTVPHSLL